MNRKIISSIALITIIALAVASGFGYYQIITQQNQISELQNQINELQDQNGELQNPVIELENMLDVAHDVKIKNFEWIGGYHSLGQMNLFQAFKVTIENTGDKNASGLTLTVKLLSAGTKAMIDEYTAKISAHDTRAGQIVEISGSVSVGEIRSYVHFAVGVVTLTLGDVLLDQQTRNLQGSWMS
jgi:hypothetical protein